MKFLTIDYIKQHSRVDFDCEDQLLELYGDSAEETLAGMLNRGDTVEEMVESLKEQYGEIPARAYHAALMLAEDGYKNRDPESQTSVNVLPGLTRIVKPLMKLSNG